MEGPHCPLHARAVAALFGPTASLQGSLGTPEQPGTVSIHVGQQVLGTGPTFAEAVAAASKRARELSQ